MSSACAAWVISTQSSAKPHAGPHSSMPPCPSPRGICSNIQGEGVNPILEVTQECHRAGTKPRGGVGGIRRAVLDPGPSQASLWVLLGSVQGQTPKLPVLLPGMVLSWAACSQEGVNGPGLVAAGLWSCVLPSCEHLGALRCCQLGSRGTNQMQPVGFFGLRVPSAVVFPSPAGRVVLGLPVQPALLEQAGDHSREMPFLP